MCAFLSLGAAACAAGEGERRTDTSTSANVVAAPAGRNAVIAVAARRAFGLEDTLKVRGEAIRSREALLAFFSSGFEGDVAERLTDRLWDAASGQVKGTELAIATPDSVVVLYAGADSAEVAFVTPVVARWHPEAPYTVAWLRRRQGVWRVAGSRDEARPPAPLPEPEPMPPDDGGSA